MEVEHKNDGASSDSGVEPPFKLHAATCDVCGVAEAKYKCPRCAKRTCSLNCVKAHKQADECRNCPRLASFFGPILA